MDVEGLLKRNKIGVSAALALAITFYDELFGNIKGRMHIEAILLSLILFVMCCLLIYSNVVHAVPCNGVFVLVLVIFLFSTRSLFVRDKK
jgi:hypothetical protein